MDEDEPGRWTHADFDGMSWHDCRIHGIALPAESHELALDIDFIVEWLCPVPGAAVEFRVAPATLVFTAVTDLALDVDSQGGALHINMIDREPAEIRGAGGVPYPYPRWLIRCHEGRLSFRATGFTQYLRVAPRLIREPGAQSLTLEERGPVSLARGRTDLGVSDGA